MSDGGGKLYKQPEPVDARERALAAADLSRSYWIEAGAGTGKTTLLIKRLMNIILSGAARLEQVVAITFTEKAAAELKQRLRSAIQQEMQQAAPEQRKLLQDALDDIEYAPITTIHSFAGSLLRERPVEAAVDPRFKVLDDAGLDELLELVWEEWLAGELLQAVPVLQRALTLGLSAQQLRDLAFLLYRQRDLVLEGSCPAPPDGMEPFSRELGPAIDELEALLLSCINQADHGCQHLQEMIKYAREFMQIDDRLERERFLLRRLPAFAARGNKANWRPAAYCDRQKEICRHLKDLQENACKSVAERLAADLVEWSRGFLAAVEQRKKADGALDFQDLLLKARNLVRDNPAVRGYFQQRFRYILVDEFQDTDPLQVDLVFLLSEQSPRAGCWQEVEPVPGKLFIVGDPKQSIYRFRRADIEIYQEAKEIMCRHGKLLSITQNFRTLPVLVDWVNHVFSRLIKPAGRFQPEYRPLHPYRSGTEKARLVVLEQGPHLSEAGAAELRAAEAEAVASLIKEAVGCWPVSGKEGERPLAYGDIALLFPTTTGVELYEEALQRHGIPYRLEGGKQFFNRPEINALRNLLQAVVNPYDRVALVAVLRYWFGVSDWELANFKRQGGAFNYLHQSASPGPGSGAVAEAFRLLAEMHAALDRLSPAMLVEELLRHTWFRQRLMVQHQGDQVDANLRKALGILRYRDQEKPLTARAFARWLDRAEKKAREEAESLLHETGGDAVQLLTAHRSKGLEFPMVALLNLGGRSAGTENFVADRRNRRFSVRITGEFTGGNYQAALEEEKKRLEAERIRLLYVAATRAGDYLVLPRYYNRKRPGFWAYLAELEEEGVELFPGGLVISPSGAGDSGFSGKIPAAASEKEHIPVEELVAGREKLLRSLECHIEAASRPGPYYSYSRLFPFEEPAMDSGVEEKRAEHELAGGRGGAAFGSAFHQLMQHISFSQYPPENGLKLAAAAARRWGIKNPAGLLRLALRTLETPLLVRARRAAWIRREVPFVLDSGGLFIEGLVDLVFPGDAGLVIVDYKTDAGTEQELEKRWENYRWQGLLYALAVGEAAGTPVQEVAFIFVRRALVKSIIRPDLQEIKKLLYDTSQQ